MGYRPPIRPTRKYSDRHKKAKAKAKKKKSRSDANHISDENHAPTPEVAVGRTLNILHNLGDQRFILPPFCAHFDRWLSNLRVAMSEFESSIAISLDDQFAKERSQILSSVAINLAEKERMEASLEEVTKILSEAKLLLERIEKEYADGTKEIDRRQNFEIMRLSGNIEVLREELDRASHIKTGFFSSISKKDKMQKEMELTQKLNSAEQELAAAEQNFITEKERLRDEYVRKKDPVIEQIKENQKELENQDIDSSLETRRATCEALTNAINAFMQRSLLS